MRKFGGTFRIFLADHSCNKVRGFELVLWMGCHDARNDNTIWVKRKTRSLINVTSYQFGKHVIKYRLLKACNKIISIIIWHSWLEEHWIPVDLLLPMSPFPTIYKISCVSLESYPILNSVYIWRTKARVDIFHWGRDRMVYIMRKTYFTQVKILGLLILCWWMPCQRNFLDLSNFKCIRCNIVTYMENSWSTIFLRVKENSYTDWSINSWRFSIRRCPMRCLIIAMQTHTCGGSRVKLHPPCSARHFINMITKASYLMDICIIILLLCFDYKRLTCFGRHDAASSTISFSSA
jgi:hypothetical protein